MSNNYAFWFRKDLGIKETGPLLEKEKVEIIGYSSD